MTNKVQKIREEVERLQNELIQEKEKGYGSDEDDACILELQNILTYIDFLQEEPVSIWHNASEEPDDMSHCLIFYGCKESTGHYLDYEPVLYNKKEKMFVTSSFPHPTGYKVEQKSFDGGCVAEVYKNRRDRISILDITQWCYLKDLHNLSNVQKTVKNWKEPASDDLEKASKEWLTPQLDKSYANYGEVKMMELTHFDGYAMLDAIEFGAKWQKEQFEKDYTNLCNGIATAKGIAVTMAYDKGMADARKQIMSKVIKQGKEHHVRIDNHGYPFILVAETLYDKDKHIPLAKKGDKVKVLVIKKE